MSERIHWRSKVQVEIDWSKSTLPQSSPLNALGSSYLLKSVQSIDPQVNTNIDVNDSIETERNGFLIRPARVVLVMNTLAAAPIDPNTGEVSLSDSAIISMLQWARALTDITISHAEGNDDFGQEVTLVDCMVNGANPMQLTTDGRPLASFNWHVLGVEGEITGAGASSPFGGKYSLA